MTNRSTALDAFRYLGCAVLPVAIVACQQPAEADASQVKSGREQRAAAATPAKAWPRPRIYSRDGKIFADGWKKINDRSYSAAPGDPSAPRLLDVAHQGEVTGASAFAAAIKAAGITNARDARTYQIKVEGDIVGTTGKPGWASGATATIGGVEQALFANTGYNDPRGGFDTTLYQIPVATLRKWGGVRFLIDSNGLSEDVEFVPATVWTDGAQATPRQQAELYAAIYDAAVTGLFNQGIAIHQQTMQTMMAINRDQNSELNCWRSSGCNYVPGAAAGQGQAVQK